MIVAATQAIQNHPSIPLYPSSMVPFITEIIPVGHNRTANSNGQMYPVHRTSWFSGPRTSPGWTRYQWPRSMASVIAPKNRAPTNVRATAKTAGSPASIPAATNATRPKIGAIRSRMGGNSSPS